jgi:hypothetical protein
MAGLLQFLCINNAPLWELIKPHNSMQSKFETLQINLLCDEQVGMIGLPKVALESLATVCGMRPFIMTVGGRHSGYDTYVLNPWLYDIAAGKWSRSDITMPFQGIRQGYYDNDNVMTSQLNDGSNICIVVDEDKVHGIAFIIHTVGMKNDNPELRFEILNYADARRYAFKTKSTLLGLKDDRVLRIGGYKHNYTNIAAPTVLDLKTKKWADVYLVREIPQDSCAIVLPDGDILVSGGMITAREATAECIIINPKDWSIRYAAPLNHARVYHTGCVTRSGDVIIFGGKPSKIAFDETKLPSVAERYNPITNTWTPLPAETDFRGDLQGCICLPDGKIMIGGGGGYEWIYDPNDNTYTKIPVDESTVKFPGGCRIIPIYI